MKIGFQMLVILGITALYSCEKSISFTPNTPNATLVVEATIENNEPPVVILSKSLNYFSQIDLDVLSGSFVHDAEVTMSNGTLTHRLKEYSIPTGNGYEVYFYSLDSSNMATTFEGALNTSYSLNIKVNGKEYNSTTTIPALTKTVDSLWWTTAPNHPDSNRVMLWGRFTDPPGYGNYVRYYTQVGQDIFYPGMASVFDDQIVDGTSYNFQIEKGINRNEDTDFEEYSFFDRGDSVTVKFCNIDKATFDFWRTMEYSFSSIGNPFSSPTKVLGNIQGGALGYFGGYAVQYRSIVIPR
jgi:hypothetical protein